MVKSLLGIQPRPRAAFMAITRRQADRACTAERKRQRPERSGGRRAAAILFRDAKPEVLTVLRGEAALAQSHSGGGK
jgi:hypothetical protein